VTTRSWCSTASTGTANTDDHLRNHGFLRTSRAGWTLSPAFDLNPDPTPGDKFLTTAIDYDDHSASVELLMEVAEHFRLSANEARAVLREVLSGTRQWRAQARALGLGSAALELMEPAFEHAQALAARELVATLA